MPVFQRVADRIIELSESGLVEAAVEGFQAGVELQVKLLHTAAETTRSRCRLEKKKTQCCHVCHFLPRPN